MPPKKKGKTVSPIVVGTVSTRSTRRQSVVNIEIPKLKEKSRTRKGKSFEKQEELSTSSSDDLCEKIKASYSKVIGTCDRKDYILSNYSLSGNSKTSINSENKELLQILEDWSDEDSEEKKEYSPRSKNQRGFENLEFGAEEIKKIISDKHFIKGESYSTNANEETETTFEDIKAIEHTLSSEKDELETLEIQERLHKNKISERNEMSQDSNSYENQACVGDSMKTQDTVSDQNSCDMLEYVTEEVITVGENIQLVAETSNLTLSENSCENIPVPSEGLDETNASFPGEVEEQNYLMKECKISGAEINPDQEIGVTEELSEEIVSPPCEEMIVLQEEELKSHTAGSTPYEEVDLSNHNNEVKINVVCEDIVMSDTESNSNNQIEVVAVAITNEETIQSFSTTDSNDSEVRNYFAKEIERNETVINVDNEIITHNEDREISSNKSSVIDDSTGESVSNSSDAQCKEHDTIPLDKHDIQTDDISMESDDIYSYESANKSRSTDQIFYKSIEDNTNSCHPMPMSNSEICPDSSESGTEGNQATSDCQQNKHQEFLENVQNSEDALTEKVAQLNLEMSPVSSKKRNRKSTVMTNNENEKKLQKNKKAAPKKSGMNLELARQLEKMDIVEEVKTKTKKNQKISNLFSGTIRNLKNNKSKGDLKMGMTEERLESMTKKKLETSITEFKKITEDKDIKEKSKKEDVKSKKKTLPILGSKIKIKLSPIKKKKEIVMKLEPDGKKKKENLKKLDQQINKKGASKKIDHEEGKKGKEQIKRKTQEDSRKEKEPFKKLDYGDWNKDIKKVEPDMQIKEIMDKSENESKSEAEGEDIEVRRSSRIKSISVLKRKTTGHGLVRSKSDISFNETDISDSSSIVTESEKSTPLGTPSASPKITPRERKTRWSKVVEPLPNEMTSTTELVANEVIIKMDVDQKPKLAAKDDPVIQARLKQFIHLRENVYKTSRMTCKEAKKMTCDCFLTEEEIGANEYGCGEDCLNRLLLIECGNFCQVGDRCTNKRFQKGQFAPVEVFNTEKKGLGLRAAANIPFGEFILEYVGEVLNSDEFDKRAEVYSQDKNIHYYFMALRADAIIDATMKGNISRFINHSCDPNAETQKWTVNGELRIGFFSTRTILAGEEITFDYRFQRYGKEAQKCFCGASICRGWLGEEPDEESEEEEYEEEEEEIVETAEVPKVTELPREDVKLDIHLTELPEHEKPLASGEVEIKDEQPLSVNEVKPEEKLPASAEIPAISPVKTEKKVVKRKVSKKKPRVELFEEIDQLNEEIEMLVATGLKNQAHTLRLSRVMVRAQDPQQRAKLLRVLRRGELPCRRLFLDYHGLRLMHGYMTDAQHLVVTDKKFESLRLEMLQTLAVLPIPNKTMLQDSKVLPTVEKWATNKHLTSPLDSDSNSPKIDQDVPFMASKKVIKKEVKKEENVPERSIEDQEEEIRFLATKLLEEWKNLKEVFRIPKKERIEQMKEHEREANKKFMQSGYGQEDKDKKLNDLRYRGSSSKYRYERESYNKKSSKNIEQYSAEFMKLSKIERRKLFAIQHELKEEERRLKQRELWRQHEVNCLMIGTDPRFTAPFDPSKPYQLIWSPQLGQWQTYPLPQNSPLITPPQPPLPSTNISHPQIPKSIPNFFTPPLPPTPTINTSIPQLPSVGIPPTVHPPPLSVPHNPHVNPLGSYSVMPNVANTVLPSLTHTQPQLNLPPTSMSQLNVTQLHGTLPPSLQQHTSLPQTVHHHATLPANMQQHSILPPNLQLHSQITPSSIPPTNTPVALPKEQKKEEDPSQVQFLGPIPDPVKLPPKWKCAKDKYGRPYYYHVKIRKSQWIPPPLTEPPAVEEAEFSESESSSDTSSESSGSSSENSDSEEDIDDTKLLMEVRKQVEKSKSAIPQHVKLSQPSTSTPSPEIKFSGESDMETDHDHSIISNTDDDVQRPSIDIRLKEQFNLKDDKPPKKKRRVGLCEEIIISPRTEEDKLQFKEDVKRYKANKEKLRRQKELIIQQTRKQLREVEQQRRAKEKRSKPSLKVKIKDKPDFHSEDAKKIKETFRANMASTVVSALNAYRKSDCKEGRITNTEDFKHLARKLTHFVMLKEMKHIAKIEDLLCSDNVKVKAREYIRKYMNKFGEVYIKRNDSPDFKD